MMHLRKLTIEYQQTRRGWHIIVHTFEQLSNGEILLAQAILCGAIGGDLKRECCNFRRAGNKVFLNVLFEPEAR